MEVTVVDIKVAPRKQKKNISKTKGVVSDDVDIVLNSRVGSAAEGAESKAYVIT